MVGRQKLFEDCKRAFIRGARAFQIAQGFHHTAQVVDISGYIGMIGSKRGFVYFQRAFIRGLKAFGNVAG